MQQPQARLSYAARKARNVGLTVLSYQLTLVIDTLTHHNGKCNVQVTLQRCSDYCHVAQCSSIEAQRIVGGLVHDVILEAIRDLR